MKRRLTLGRGVAFAHLMLAIALVASLALAACSSASSPSGSPAGSAGSSGKADKEPFKIGVTSALTGPAAAAMTAHEEGMRVYMENLNAKGGIDGHPIQLFIEDDAADGGKAATNAQKFVGMGVQLLVITSLSSTYTPVINEAKRANIPVFIPVNAPKEALPPTPEQLVFAGGQIGAAYTDGARVVSDAMLLSKGAAAKIAFVSVDSPNAVLSGQQGVAAAKAMGAQADMKTVPMSTSDYTAIASDLMGQGYNWASGIGPSVGANLLAALDKLGWKGSHIDTNPMDVSDLLKLKSESLYYTSPTGPVDPSRADHKEFLDATKKYNATVVTSATLVGWSNGAIVAEIMRKTGWPANTEKLLKTMNNFSFPQGQVYPPTTWSEKDHWGPLYWRMYKWDKANNKVVPAAEWYRIDGTGDPKSIVKVGDKLP